MAYKGKIHPSTLKNPHKYCGNINNMIFRSLWERCMAMWCDINPSVVKWSMEEYVVKYLKPGTDKIARYYIDFYVEFKDGREMLIEIKPEKETIQPVLKEGKRISAKFKRDMQTYAVNQEKWRVAKKFASANGMEFYVFTEKTLDKLGIMRSGPLSENPERGLIALEHKNWRKPKVAKPKRPASSFKKFEDRKPTK